MTGHGRYAAATPSAIKNTLLRAGESPALYSDDDALGGQGLCGG